MLPTKEQAKKIHVKAADFAVKHYTDPKFPEVSVLVTAGEEYARTIAAQGELQGELAAVRACLRDAFVESATWLLLTLRGDNMDRDTN